LPLGLYSIFRLLLGLLSWIIFLLGGGALINEDRADLFLLQERILYFFQFVEETRLLEEPS
jgi:hypothetical protein